MNERRANPRAGVGCARCLLWLPAGYEPPAMLLDGLRSRDVVVRQANDAPAVMTELAEGGFNTLVIVEPGLLRGPQRVVDAVGRYHPNIKTWRFVSEGQPLLRPWADKPAQATQAAPPVVDSALPHESVEPREPEPVGDVPLEEPLEPVTTEPPLLSDEELAMLLQEPEDEDRP